MSWRQVGWMTPFVLGAAALYTQFVEAQGNFPRVYGSTGRPYGPTQAHYQYQRQYGRPWHGYGGNTSFSGPRHHHITLPGAYFPAYYGGAYFAGFQTYGLQPTVFQPVVNPFSYPVSPAGGLGFAGPGFVGTFGIYGNSGGFVPHVDHRWAQNPALGPTSGPAVTVPLPANNFANVLQQHQLGQQGLLGGPLKPQATGNAPDAVIDPVTQPALMSSTTARLRSIHAQGRGDAHFRAQQWKAAFADYQEAVQTAPDRPLAHLRLAVAAIQLQNFEMAVFELKRAAFLDPQIVDSAPQLVHLFGAENRVAQNAMIQQVTAFAEQDISDPDRLFLLGVMLRLHGDPRFAELLQSGLRLAGRGQHFQAYLRGAGTATNVSQPANGPITPLSNGPTVNSPPAAGIPFTETPSTGVAPGATQNSLPAAPPPANNFRGGSPPSNPTNSPNSGLPSSSGTAPPPLPPAPENLPPGPEALPPELEFSLPEIPSGPMLVPPM